MEPSFDLDGKTAIVTGGAGLIGRAACRALAAHGASVVIADQSRERGTDVADDVGDAARFVRTDVTDDASVRETVRETAADGRLDVLVNCAYPEAGSEAYGQPFEAVSPTEWREHVDQHLAGHVLAIRAATDVMSEQSTGGSVITFGSIYGIRGPDFGVYEGTEMTSPSEYAAAKGAIVNLTRHLASSLGPRGIRVNAISPGGVFDEQPARFVEQYEERVPLGRMAEPEDIGGAVVFLASDASKYVTGHNLVVDGGWTIH